MNTIGTFTAASALCSKSITTLYSTSFSWAIRLLHPKLQPHIHAIYGFVRLADEIVDTFHAHDKRTMLEDLRQQTFSAIREGISLNPVLQSFQHTVNAFNIPAHLIESFLGSMAMDLDKKQYHTQEETDGYIYGSAEVVGLMCLMVFCEGQQSLYEQLTPAARQLGAAFQKVNFLRDLEDDNSLLQRRYFPDIDLATFDVHAKRKVEANIKKDFIHAFEGIRGLPVKARFGVYVAYRYYLSLFHRICRHQPSFIRQHRVRVPNYRKLAIILDAGLRNSIGAW